MTEHTFSSLGLNAAIQKAVEAEGYSTPTPIQIMAIPALLAGRDLLGLAQTGTGKTAAFALPLIQRLNENPVYVPDRGTRILVVAPTRELAIQIDNSFSVYGKHSKLRRACIFGGVGSLPQERSLKQGVDVLTATPGRLLDLIERKHLSLSSVEAVVFDEADRMFDMGFIHDIKRIVKLLPQTRQTLLFSATMPDAIVEFANSLLKDPVQAEVPSARPTADRVEQRLLFVSRENKRHLLAAIMKEDGFSRVIVFTRTKHGANRLCKQLGPEGIQAEAIHANKSQGQRQRTMKAFREGKIQMLVATDLAARGIDVDDIELVVNFDLPNEPETYVHRIGRTARAGSEGLAISFCDIEERTLLRDIERFIGFRVPVETDHPYALDTEALPLNGGKVPKTPKGSKKKPFKQNKSNTDSPSRDQTGRKDTRQDLRDQNASQRPGSRGTPTRHSAETQRPGSRDSASRHSGETQRPGSRDSSSRHSGETRGSGPRASSSGPGPNRPTQGGRQAGGHSTEPGRNRGRPKGKGPGRGSGDDSQTNVRLTARKGLEVEEYGVAALFAGRSPAGREAGASRFDERQPATNTSPASAGSSPSGRRGGSPRRDWQDNRPGGRRKN